MKKIYNKLVRDNIPNIIEQDNEMPFTRILDDSEYRTELYRKLTEECNEVLTSESSEETLEELADVLEVIRSIAKLENKKLDDVIEIANKKRTKRGGFEKRIFLEKTVTK